MINGDPWAIEISSDPWWVYHSLADGDRDLVIPKPFRRDGASPSAGDPWEERYQLIILGFAFACTDAGGDEGFQLLARDANGDKTIYRYTSSSSRTEAGSVNCYIKLSPASAASPSSDAATLRIDVLGGTGNITIWGVHRSAYGKREQTGSPYTYS